MVNYDASAAMLEQFDNNLEDEHRKFQRKEIRGDIFKIKENKDLISLNKKFDVIILSIVLSSMKYDPSFQDILDFLNEDGILIIADIEPSYKKYKPKYHVGDYSLNTREMNPIEIIEKVQKCDMYLNQASLIKADEKSGGEVPKYFANILQFSKRNSLTPNFSEANKPSQPNYKA